MHVSRETFCRDPVGQNMARPAQAHIPSDSPCRMKGQWGCVGAGMRRIGRAAQAIEDQPPGTVRGHRGRHAGVRGGRPGEERQTGARCRPGGHRGPPLPKNDGLVGRRGRGDRTDIADVRDRRRVGHPRCVRPAARATRRALACGPNLLIDDQSVGGLDAVAAGRGRPPCRPAVYGGARTVIDGPSIVALRNATGIGTAAQEDSSGSTRAASIGSGPRACFT